MNLKQFLGLFEKVSDLLVFLVLKDHTGLTMRLEFSVGFVGTFIQKATEIPFQWIP
jgi:hypothetical protein